MGQDATGFVGTVVFVYSIVSILYIVVDDDERVEKQGIERVNNAMLVSEQCNVMGMQQPMRDFVRGLKGDCYCYVIHTYNNRRDILQVYWRCLTS
jgi:hypothetical protein